MSDTQAQERRTNAQGLTARAQIVAAAEEVLKRDGFHGFSTRRVAEACGISVGNLTYHFPSKASLIEALMAEVCARYAATRRPPEDAGKEEPRAYLERIIHWLVEDAASPGTSALFQELWVMARHHPSGAAILDAFYEQAASWIEGDLALSYPQASPDALARAAWLILTMTEGSTPLFSRGTEWPGGWEDLARTVADAVERVLSA